MKSTGIVRQIDEAGRLVLPKELRMMFSLDGDTSSVEIFTDNDKIILRKYAPSCVFCDTADDVVDFKGKKVCPNCIKKLQSIVE